MKSTYTGRRAEQLISGATKMVAKRARRSSMVRVAIMPGTAQAKLDSRGMKAVPESPTRVSSRSINSAARAM